MQRLKRAPRQKGAIDFIAQGTSAGKSFQAAAEEAGVCFQRVRFLEDADAEDAQLLSSMLESIEDANTAALMIYLESLSKGREFLALASRAAARKLPVLVLRSGIAPECWPILQRLRPRGCQTDETMWEGVAKQFGIILLKDIQQMLDLGKICSMQTKASGSRTALVSFSEEVALLQGDQCVSAGLPLAFNGPVVLSADMLEQEELLFQYLESLQQDSACDMILIAAGALTPSQGEKLSWALSHAVRLGPKPIACCAVTPWLSLKEMVRRMNSGRVPLFSSPRRAAEAMACLGKMGKPPALMPDLPAPSTHPFLERGASLLSERDAVALVERYGLKTVPHRLCHSFAEVFEAAGQIGFPMALKVVSPSFASKQSVRAIALNLKTAEELRNAFGRILERAHRLREGAEIQGVFAQKMISDGIECMIGVKRDALFGPVVAVALGGAYYGLMKDIALRVAPVSFETAMEMVRSLKGYPLISGEWSGIPMDVRALAEQIVKLSVLICSEPDLQEMDINPIFVRPAGKGAEIADAFAVRRQARAEEPKGGSTA